jgi:hypothetical protein
MIPIPIVAVTLAFVALCMAVDARTRRVPDLISVSNMLAGAALNTLYFGATGRACASASSAP